MIEQFEGIVGRGQALTEEPMSRHTTFRVGGPAQYFLMPQTVEQVKNLVDFCKKNKVPYYVIGNGSNLLVKDEGIRGAVIQLQHNFAEITITGNILTAQAGAMMGKIGKLLLEESLTGFEPMSGIPGTLGGAVCMNAGAYGGEMKDVITSVTVLTTEGEIRIISSEDMDFGYRHSIVTEKGYIVLEATMELKPGKKEEIQAAMDDFKQRRQDKQPLEYPSAGSTFKRPEGFFAGKLIQDAGLAGYQVGGAAVSAKHCGFVINAGGATAAELLQLISDVQRKVKENFEVELELEVKVIGG